MYTTQSVNNSENRADEASADEPFFDDEGSPDKKGNEAEAIIGGKQSNDFAEVLPDMQKRSVERVQNRFTRSIKRTFGFPKKMNMKSFGEFVSKMASEYIDSGKI